MFTHLLNIDKRKVICDLKFHIKIDINQIFTSRGHTKVMFGETSKPLLKSFLNEHRDVG